MSWSVTMRSALRSFAIEVSVADDGALIADASADQVGDVALSAGVALRELGSTRDGGLEQLFFELTRTAGHTGVADAGHAGAAGADPSPSMHTSTLQETLR
jgi:hypothetical protein